MCVCALTVVLYDLQTRTHYARSSSFCDVDERAVLYFASRVLRRQLAALLNHANPALFANLADVDTWRATTRKLVKERLARVQVASRQFHKRGVSKFWTH